MLFLPIYVLFFSCQERNSQSSTTSQEAVHTTSEIQQKESIQVDKIALNQQLDTLLKSFRMTKDDNSNATYNINMDYEEFAFDNSNTFTFKSLEIGEIESLVVYYMKTTGEAFCYELEVQNNPQCKALYSAYSTTLGEKTFDKKIESTKDRPIFLDENGEQETDHIIQELTKVVDRDKHSTYYLIYKENLTSKENKLTVIAISDSSEKRDEWVKFRSLDMVFE